MFAIVNIKGQQLKVEEGAIVFVNKLQAEPGEQIAFDEVLLIENDGETKVGTPTVSGSKVNTTVVEHVKGDKVIVFKKKRRKGYQVKNGHRQQYTKINIDSISI